MSTDFYVYAFIRTKNMDKKLSMTGFIIEHKPQADNF